LQEQYGFHINILKWTGVVVLLALMTTTLALTSRHNVNNNVTDCLKIKSESHHEFNNTLCDFIKQFRLPENYYITVCLYQHSILIRQFISGKATIKGLSLSL
jgi:hypothetical protein